MKKIISISLCTTALLLATNTMAFTWPWHSKNIADHKTATTKTQEKAIHQPSAGDKNTQINLYADPKLNAKVLKELPIDANLVTIFHQGEWVKVGDRKDGTTGWVNLKQYRTAKQNFYRNYFHEKTQTLYFHSEKDKDGKVSMVAYRNGKKLSDTETKELFQHLKQEENQQWEAMQQFNHMIDLPLMTMPGIVVIEHRPETNKPTTSVSSH